MFHEYDSVILRDIGERLRHGTANTDFPDGVLTFLMLTKLIWITFPSVLLCS